MLNLPFLPEIFLGVMFLVLITCGIVEFIRAPRGRLLACFVLRGGSRPHALHDLFPFRYGKVGKKPGRA
ncbi:MAG: hypothetical protein V8T87_04245 [Victivallales bacterium]